MSRIGSASPATASQAPSAVSSRRDDSEIAVVRMSPPAGPGCGARGSVRSTTATRKPASASASATDRPDRPAPAITASARSMLPAP